MPSIVTVNVSENVAPTPSKLQQTGAFLSQEATDTAPGTLSLLTQMSDLTPLLTGALPLTTIAWSSSVATATATAPHGFTIGDTIEITITGATPTGYNGTHLATVTTTTAFTYPLVSNPGAIATPGVYTPEDVAELIAMATTFFAQGNSQAVYILELGPGSAADGVTFLTAYLIANPQTLYSVLTPRTWASEPTFPTLIQSYEAPSAKFWFFVTMTLENYTNFTPLMSRVVGLIEAPTITPTEFSLASAFFVTLHYNPSATNKVTPLSFSFVFGVTPYPTVGNGSLLQTLKNANVNYIGTGAEGGISNTIFVWGTGMDGNPFNFFWAADWVSINLDLQLSNEIINGSNNPINPLYYNQPGINRLQSKAAAVMSQGVTFGIVLFSPTQPSLDGPVLDQNLDNGDYVGFTVVNAVPFITYSEENPGDYKIGVYNGLSVSFVPLRGFEQITINLVVSSFVAG